MGVGGVRNDFLSDCFAKGTWIDNENRTDSPRSKNDLYEVEDEQFVKEIKGRKPYQDGIERIKEDIRKNGRPTAKNQDYPANYTFAGPQTASENQYGDLEWDLGSYTTNIHIDNYDPVTGEVKVSSVTKNEFHLSSLTRINGGGQTKITDTLNTYWNEPINSSTAWINETTGTNYFSSDVNVTSPTALVPDTENGEGNGEYYGAGIGAVVTRNPYGMVAGAVVGNNVGESYDVEFRGSDTFNVND